MNTFLQPQTIAALKARSFIYSLLPVEVPAASGNQPGLLGSAQIPFQAGYHFFAESLVCQFTTGDEEEDNGSSLLDVQIRDASNNISLTANYVPVRLISAPGRMSRPGLAGSPPGDALMIDGFALPGFFQANGGIIFDLRNSAEAPQLFSAAMKGWLIPITSVSGADDLARVVAQMQATAPWVEGG